MTERPILFSGPMVKALLAGTKTQTRRLVTRGTSFLDGYGYGYASTTAAWASLDFAGEHGRQPFVDPGPSPAGNAGPYLQVPKPETETVHRVYPRWFVGEHLWVKETWHPCDGGAIYAANYGGDKKLAGIERWVSGIYMPRAESRITLEITSVAVQRLQEISGTDILAEGVVARPHHDALLGKMPVSAFDGCAYLDLRSLWVAGWDSINGKKAPWKTNPWVWCVSFRRLP